MATVLCDQTLALATNGVISQSLISLVTPSGYRLVDFINEVEEILKQIKVTNGFNEDVLDVNIRPIQPNDLLKLKAADLPLLAVNYFNERYDYSTQRVHEVNGGITITGYRRPGAETQNERRDNIHKFGVDIKRAIFGIHDDNISGAFVVAGFLNLTGDTTEISYWPQVYSNFDVVEVLIPVKYDERDTGF